jgi:hypothetical protein
MRHIDDGTLRRVQDEPLLITESQREHLEACERCRERATSTAADMRSAVSLLAAPLPAFDGRAALARFERQVKGRSQSSPARRRLTLWLHTYRTQARATGGIAAAAVLVGSLTLTPAGSLAQSFISTFQPQTVQPLYVSTSDLQSLPQLQDYGTVNAPGQIPAQTVADAAAASQVTGMHVLVPSTVPAGVPFSVSYEVTKGATGTFTFSAAKAQSTAASKGETLPNMPAGIDGSTLDLKVGAAVVAAYGQSRGVPALVVGQAVAPTVSSTGASVQDIENYVLKLPGVSKSLADSIRAMGDPATTQVLPIPIPVDKANAQTVTIDGVKGVAVGDSTGAGSAVIWEKDGIIHGVVGTLTESQVIDVANSLH